MPENKKKTSQAQINASMKWNASKATITLRIDPELNSIIREAAKEEGKSVTQYILNAIDFYQHLKKD
ncbi:MAG: DUF1778 domain-containing protein [Oscillospiraceae bacterium]|nr:DUF1778 domain-containing protein [Oscillospiraceae bacterium]